MTKSHYHESNGNTQYILHLLPPDTIVHHQDFLYSYLQPIITQYFIDNKSEIWLLFLIAHSKR